MNHVYFPNGSLFQDAERKSKEKTQIIEDEEKKTENKGKGKAIDVEEGKRGERID